MTVLLVATPGGHITELIELERRLAIDAPRVWLTARTPQTESLLAGRAVVWVPPVLPRDARAIVRLGARVPGILARNDVRAVVSTGAAIALAVLPIATARGIPSHYIESVTRPAGLSMTGRLLAATPGVHLYTQYRNLETARWAYRGSVFDGIRVHDRAGTGAIRRVVVTLGTMRDFPFRRFVERLIDILPRHVDVLWQTGCTPVDGLPIAGADLVPQPDLLAAMRDADVVVGHCGVGTVLGSLRAGRFPVAVPRAARFGENIDDHQFSLGTQLERLGIALVRRVEDLALRDLACAAQRGVECVEPPPFVLRETRRARRSVAS